MSILISFCMSLTAFAGTVAGGVTKQTQNQIKSGNQVIDATSGQAIPYAVVTIPQKNYKTKTNDEGKFKLGTKINAPTIMSVQKDGYKPFSLTLDEKSTGKPLVVGIEKSNPKDIIIETDMIHLGDDSFSANSANAGDFAVHSIGPFYSKSFNIKQMTFDENAYIVLGSVIGIDTIMAQEIGQSHVTTAYANPPQVYCNGNKIAEIKINGDGQQIKIPKSVINQGNSNDITIKAGKNMMQTAYVDYDDIEFTNIIIEIK
ncbi:MAG: hypothetical protein PHV37_00410 [Candidatus Gastranaerophilales bacterium]|nr:hypothetical protein [Candidatus Gastranaerophilales bacterium]